MQDYQTKEYEKYKFLYAIEPEPVKMTAQDITDELIRLNGTEWFEEVKSGLQLPERYTTLHRALVLYRDDKENIILIDQNVLSRSLRGKFGNRNIFRNSFSFLFCLVVFTYSSMWKDKTKAVVYIRTNIDSSADKKVIEDENFYNSIVDTKYYPSMIEIIEQRFNQ